MIINIINFNPNIGHFLHEEFQYAIDIIFKNNDKNIEIYVPDYIISSNLYRWHFGILKILSEKNKNIQLIYNIENKDNIININPGYQMIINLDYIRYLRKNVLEYYNILDNNIIPKYKVLYTRINDTNRRHILNYEVLQNDFDLIIHSLNISFEDKVRLFNKTTHFVSD